MFRIVILLEIESTTNWIEARWYCMALEYTVILLFFHNSFNFFELNNASVAETAPSHYWATAMFCSWHNTIWFESFIDFSANILTPMATEKFEFWFVCP